MPARHRAHPRRGVTLIEPIIWLVVMGTIAVSAAAGVAAFMARAGEERVVGQLEQLAAVGRAEVERDRGRTLQLDHLSTPELVEVAGPVTGTETDLTVSVAVAPDGLDAVAAMVSDSNACVVLTLPRFGPHTVAVRDDVDVAAGGCEAGLLLP